MGIKKSPAIALLLSIMAFSAFADEFQEKVASFSRNQESIKTFIGSGFLNMEIYDLESGKIINQARQPMTIYMKYPDSFKLDLTGSSPMTMVQKGNLVSQKLAGTDTIVTNKVSDSSDLFKKYFSYGLVEQMASAQVQSQSQITVNGLKMTVYSFKPALSTMKGADGKNITIDRTEISFDQNNLLVRSALFSGSTALVRTDFTYTQKGNIYVISSMTVETISGKMRIKSATEYSAVSVNTQIADREFELK